MSVYPPSPAMVYGGANGTRNKKRPANELTKQENEMLFSLIGSDAVSLSAAVVQLLKSDRGIWKLELRHGVISLVKDYSQRAYFLRIFDILDERLLWEFRLYSSFKVQTFDECSRLLYFNQSPDENGEVVIGLNFYSEAEASEFKEHLFRRHKQENKNRQHHNQSRG